MGLLIPDSGLLFWMVVSFAIVFFILWKFGFPIITKAADSRTKKIEDALEAAQSARDAVASLQQKGEEIMNEAMAQRQACLAETASLNKKLIEEAKEQARAESSRIMEEARLQISAQKEAAIKEMSSYMVNLSVAIAEKILKEKLDDSKYQEEFAGKLLEEAEQVNGLKS